MLTLHLWHLTDRMLLARGGKQGRRKENSEEALTNKGSHNALAQLSVSDAACKAKARWEGATAGGGERFDHAYEQKEDED